MKDYPAPGNRDSTKITAPTASGSEDHTCIFCDQEHPCACMVGKITLPDKYIPADKAAPRGGKTRTQARAHVSIGRIDPGDLGNDIVPLASNPEREPCTCVGWNPQEGQSSGEGTNFQINFGETTDCPELSPGSLEVQGWRLSEQFATGTMFYYNHVSQRRIAAIVPSTRREGNRVALITQHGHVRYYDFSDADAPGGVNRLVLDSGKNIRYMTTVTAYHAEGRPVGGSEIFGEILRMVNSDGSDFSGPVENAPYFEEILYDSVRIRYHGTTGKIVHIQYYGYPVRSLAEIESELKVIKCDGNGEIVEDYPVSDNIYQIWALFPYRIRQIWSRAGGLLDLPSSTEIRYYSPSDITANISNGLFQIKSNATPAKTWTLDYEIDGDGNITRFEITQQGASQTYNMVWQPYGNGTLHINGHGDEALVSVTTREALAPAYSQIIRPGGRGMNVKGKPTGMIAETVRTYRGAKYAQNHNLLEQSQPLHSKRKVIRNYPFGDVIISRSIRWGMPDEKTWQYIYGQQTDKHNYGKIIKTINPDGTLIEMDYDHAGHRIYSKKINLDGSTHTVEKTYVNQFVNDTRPSVIKEYISTPDGTTKTIRHIRYSYDQGDGYRRQVIRHIGPGSRRERTATIEHYTEHPLPTAIGKVRRNISNDGTETLHEYLPTTAYAAEWKHIQTQQINGVHIPGYSRRYIQYNDSRGDQVASIEQIYTGTGFSTIDARLMIYDEAHKIIKTQYLDGRTETSGWACCGPLWQSRTDGSKIRYTYNSVKQLIREEQEQSPASTDRNACRLATVTEYEYDTSGNTISTTRSIINKNSGDIIRSTVASAKYSAYGIPSEEIDETGLKTTYQHSADYLTTTVTRPDGTTITTVRDRNGYILSETGSALPSRYFTYEDTDDIRITRVHLDSPDGLVIRETIHNGDGEILSERIPAANGSGMVSTEYEYDLQGRIIVTRREGAPVEYTDYDAAGRVTRIVLKYDGSDQSLRDTRYSYAVVALDRSVPGYPASLPDGALFLQTMTSVSAPLTDDIITESYTLVAPTNDIEHVTFSRNLYGRWSWSVTQNRSGASVTRSGVEGIDGETETVTRDGHNISITGNTGVTIRFDQQETPDGGLHTTTDARGNTTMTQYDAAGRHVRSVDAAGNSSTRQRDPRTGQLTGISRSDGSFTGYHYDLSGRIAARYGTDTHPVAYEYDAEGQLTAMHTWRQPDTICDRVPDSSPDTTRWIRDAITGQVTAKIYADGSTETITYDRLGRQLKTVNGNGLAVRLGYDKHGLASRLVEAPAGCAAEATTYSHDAAGRVERISGPLLETGFQYDNLGRKISETIRGDHGEFVITDKYAPDGAMTGYVLSLNGYIIQTVNYIRDRFARLETIVLDQDHRFTCLYDRTTGASNELIMPNGLTLTVKLHDKLNKPAVIGYVGEDDANIFRQTLAYDSTGHITEIEETTGSVTHHRFFAYNTRHELISAQRQPITGSEPDDDGQWTYDNISNRISALRNGSEDGYAANCVNQYDNLHEYDAAGNQVTLRGPSGQWRITYNALNRPVIFKAEALPVGPGLVDRIEMAYDHAGRRIEKRSFSGSALLKRERFFYLGYQLVARLVDHGSGQWSIDATWLRGPGSHQLLAMTKWHDGRTIRYYYCLDHNANVKELTSQTGQIVETFDYDPFGRQYDNLHQETIDNPFGYSSEYTDRELGLIYYNFRHYNPSDGRWLSRDPIAENSNPNLYNFTNNNPVNYRDHLGLWMPCAAAGGLNNVNPTLPYYKGDHQWCATDDSDTLEELAQQYNATVKDKDCLWPRSVNDIRDYPNVVRNDVYDANNISHKHRQKLYYSIDVMGYNAFWEILKVPEFSYVYPQDLARILKQKSGQGKNPINYLLVEGHGIAGFAYMIGYSEAGNEYSAATFDLDQLIWEANNSPSYTRASQDQGPLRCWFSRKSTIHYLGCKTQKMAKETATRAIRNHGTVWGTKYDIFFEPNLFGGWSVGYTTDNSTIKHPEQYLFWMAAWVANSGTM